MALSAVCVGDNCVDYYLPPINLQYIGGNAVNVAVYLRRAGIQSAYVGTVGDDANGELTLNKLCKEDINVSCVRIVPGQTAITHILLTPSNERQFVYEYPGPQPTLNLDEQYLNYISRYNLVHNTMAGGTESYLSRFKRKSDLIVSMDYGDRSLPEFIDRTLPYVDLAFFSMSEQQRDEAEDLVQSIFSQGLRLIVVTLGSGGSLVYDGHLHYQDAIPIEVVDTLGAGDAYIGSFLAYWMRGEEISYCMNKASIEAARTCTHFGGWSQPENPKIIDLSA